MSKYVRFQEHPEAEVWKLCFQNQAAKYRLKQPYMSMSQEVLPGIDSLDPRFHHFLRHVAAELNETLDRGTSEGFAGPSAVSADFGIICCASGVRARPSGYVIHDNRCRREANGLTIHTPSSDDAELFRRLMDLMFSEHVRKPISVAKQSSSGLPDIVFDAPSKIKKFDQLFGREGVDETMRAIVRRDGASLIARGCVPAYVQNYRNSADVPGKTRYVADLEYATSNGEKGNFLATDKTVYYPNGKIAEGIGGLRARHVQGLQNALNLAIAVWRGGTMEVCHSKYSFTWKHRGGADIEDKLNGWCAGKADAAMQGVDVTQFDNSCPDWCLREFCSYGAGRFFSEEFGKMCDILFHAPVFQPETGDGMGAIFHGDPLTIEGPESPGLMSGNDLVAPIGKLVNMWNYFVILSRIIGHEAVKNRMHDILLGRDADFGHLNMGDDGVLLFSTHDLMETFFEKADSGYLAIDKEPALKFLGYVLVKKDDGTVKAYNDVTSFMRGTFVPERAWDSKFREFWHVGLAAKYQLYGESPSFPQVLEITDKWWQRSYPELGRFTTWSEYLIESNRYHVPKTSSMIELDLLVNPNKIHYLYDEQDISEEFGSRLFSKIPYEAVEHLYDRWVLSSEVTE